MGLTMKIINENCDKAMGEDRSLPYDAFIIEYKVDGKSCYDIAAAAKQVEIFDHYWDKYGQDFVFMKQTEGRANQRCGATNHPKPKTRSDSKNSGKKIRQNF